MERKTIEELVTDTLIIDKSKFISFLIPLHSKEQIEEEIKKYRDAYKDATHVCYAYIYNENGVESFKCYDDGEPSSTAGAPILNMLKVRQLENVICFVVRYFGGIKLGAGGLIRAYGNSTLLVINKAKIVTLIDAYFYSLSFGYNFVKLMDKYLENIKAKIEKKEYDMQVTYDVILLNENDIEKIKDYFSNMIEVKNNKIVQITI